MLTVLSPDEALALICEKVNPLNKIRTVPLLQALGCTLAEDICADEYVPGFDRSTVDGYALRASDSFGCSESIPALLMLSHSVEMGETGGKELPPGYCAYVPTGAALPPGADAVAMIEYCESFGDGTIAFSKPAAPGENIIYKGDDVYPGKLILRRGRRISSRDIGALSAMGVSGLKVYQAPVVGVISTGDELVDIDCVPGQGQIRDSNSYLLDAMMREFGAEPIVYGIVRDDEDMLSSVLDKALAECDCVLVSGGSSVGTKDATAKVIEARAELLFHGLAIKPGKPSIFGMAGNKPIFGLPGHPGAACYVSEIFVRTAIDCLFGRRTQALTLTATMEQSVSANHGRAQYGGIWLERDGEKWLAKPIRSKSGLISSFAEADGFYCIPRNREGFAAGDKVEITLYNTHGEV